MQRVLEGGGRLGRVVVRPAEGLGYHLVDGAQLLQVVGVDLQGLRGPRRGGTVLPEDRGAALRA